MTGPVSSAEQAVTPPQDPSRPARSARDERRLERADRRARSRADLHLFRLVPGSTPVHALWAGTKILALFLMGLALAIKPTWPVIGTVAAITLGTLLLARIPRGAAPRIPTWFIAMLALGAVLSLRGGAKPEAQVLGITVSLGALDDWAKLTAVALELLLAAAVVAWTTQQADVAPAFARLSRPLRWLRLPVDEWTAAIALSLRCFPMLFDEMRTMAAARRLRSRRGELTPDQIHPKLPTLSRQRWFRLLVIEPVDLLVAAMTVSLRRGRELGEAIEARGGFGRVADQSRRAERRDVIALVGIVVLLLASLVV